MSKIKRVLRCNHCGAVLQCENENEEGYIRRDVYEYTGDRILYCEKCYEQKMINTAKTMQDVNLEVYSILRDAKSTDSLVVYVIDLCAFNGSLKPGLVQMLKGLNVLVIANKRDLLPDRNIENNIKESVISHFKDNGVDVVDAIIVSASKNYNIEEVKEKISQYRERRDVYLIGSSISGKTSIIDKLLMHYENKTRRKVETIVFPDTQTKVLCIPLDNSSSLYELPGLELNDSVLGIVEKSLANKYIIVKKTLKERKFRLGKDDSLVVGGLAIYTNKSEEPIDVKAYFAETVELKKVGKSGLNLFFKTNLLKRDLRPVSDLLQSFDNFDLFGIETDNTGEEREIGIKGLGFITFKAKGNYIHVLAPRGAGVKEGKARI